jgi:hypothetical protein
MKQPTTGFPLYEPVMILSEREVRTLRAAHTIMEKLKTAEVLLRPGGVDAYHDENTYVDDAEMGLDAFLREDLQNGTTYVLGPPAILRQGALGAREGRGAA